MYNLNHNNKLYRISGLNFSGRLVYAECYSDILNDWIEVKNVSILMQLAKKYKEDLSGK